MYGRYLLLLLLFCFAFVVNFSCKKEKAKLTINGSVYDPNQGLPVANAIVDVAVQKVSSGTFQANYSHVETIETDANGNFTFEQDYELIVSYRLDIERDGYFTKSYVVPSEKTEADVPYNASFDLLPVGWLKLKVKTFAADTINVRRFTEVFPECIECCTADNERYIGPNVNISTVCKMYGATEVKIKGNYSDGGVKTDFTITKNIQPFDTTTIDVAF